MLAASFNGFCSSFVTIDRDDAIGILFADVPLVGQVVGFENDHDQGANDTSRWRRRRHETAMNHERQLAAIIYRCKYMKLFVPKRSLYIIGQSSTILLFSFLSHHRRLAVGYGRIRAVD